METKPLLYGLIGFFIGGLLVSVTATTFDKPTDGITMESMTSSLQDKTGDEFDKAFLSHMIEHHEAAVQMADLSASQAKHQEIKDLSSQIIAAQEDEIRQMKRWQQDWGYENNHSSMNH